jgi:stage II sporulation protein D
VAAELEHVADRAALEAGAIAIRSYLVAHLGRHAAEGFDFCDTTHCLFSKGLPDATAPSSRDAVAAAESTRGLVLERDGHVVAGYFTACCGGRTATPAEIWGGEDDGDYESVACSFCKASAYYRWRRSSSARAVGAALAGVAGTRVGPDAALDVVAGPGGWVRSVVIRSNGRVATVNGDAFRMAVERRLGWNSIPSPRFTIEHTRDSVVFSGGGFGHGVGLCVAGSVERARRGAGRDELLRAYFPRARVVLLESVP